MHCWVFWEYFLVLLSVFGCFGFFLGVLECFWVFWGCFGGCFGGCLGGVLLVFLSVGVFLSVFGSFGCFLVIRGVFGRF